MVNTTNIMNEHYEVRERNKDKKKKDKKALNYICSVNIQALEPIIAHDARDTE